MGRHEHPLFRVWQGMLNRCYNPKAPRFHRWGGRGIGVCERWRNSLETFAADMGPRPSSRHTLDRIDNDGDYTPENCRWATPKEQSRNGSRNRLIVAYGRTMAAIEWSEELGISYQRILDRLRLGEDGEAALRPREETLQRLTAFGETLTIAAWAKRCGLRAPTLRARLRNGWTLEAALRRPRDSRGRRPRSSK